MMTELHVVETVDPCEGLAELGYPPSLVKACCDPFDYALGLRDGRVIEFYTAFAHGDWVTLVGQEEWHTWTDAEGNRKSQATGDTPVAGLPYACPRGVDIRVADIVWCADAPNGS